MILPEAEGLSRKIGLRSQNIGYGKYSGVMDFMTRRSPDVLRSLQRSADSVYVEFKSRVASGRKLSPEDVESIAQGQVWSAQTAMEKGLVDGIGSLNDAVRMAAELAGITNYGTLIYPTQKPFWHLFRGTRLLPSILSFFSSHRLSEVEMVEAYIKQRFTTHEWLFAMPFDIEQ